MVEPALGAVAGLGRWFVGAAVLLKNAGVLQMRRRRSVTRAQRALAVCEWPALGMPWTTAKSDFQYLQCAAGVVEPALGAADELSR